MNNLSDSLSKVSTAIALGNAVVLSSMLLGIQIVFAQKASFSDVSDDYWAKSFIEKLAKEDIIAGFPDGTFKPNQPVTRAQFAAIVRKAFNQDAVRNKRSFSDLPAKYWAIPAIDKAYSIGFLSGYPDGTFRPEQQIPKVQALVSLSSGLGFEAASDSLDKTLSVYKDNSEIPDYARKGVAAATQKSVVVNYPNISYLNPNEIATRADIAALVYQALVSKGEFTALSPRSDGVAYIVNYKTSTTGTTPPPSTNTGSTDTTSSNLLVSRGTVLPVQMLGGNDVKLIIATGETIQTTLELSSNVLNTQGKVLIPKGSQVQGQFQPVRINGTTQGTQYYADKVSINSQNFSMVAISDPLVPTSRQALSTNTLRGGLASAATQLLLGRLLGGDTNVGNLLGTLSGGNNSSTSFPTNQEANSVIVVEPKKMTLKVQSDFKLASQLLKSLSLNDAKGINVRTLFSSR
jgi:hypothetical protein